MSLATKAVRRAAQLGRLVAYRTMAGFGHNDYARFIVLTRSRTGSNLLLSFLNAHPEIFAEGEIFAKLKGRNPLERLNSAFGKQPRHIRAKGFKIFYYHPLDGKAEELWDELTAREDIRVIHLTRQNILRTLLSRKIAGIQDTWTGTRFDAVNAKSKRVQFTVQELQEGFRQTRTWESAAAARFGRHPVLNVSYEELIADPRQTLIGLFAFLKVRNEEPRTSLRRQNPENLQALILNYEKLKKAFEATPWAVFFED